MNFTTKEAGAGEGRGEPAAASAQRSRGPRSEAMVVRREIAQLGIAA
jgi:hypothetical protein